MKEHGIRLSGPKVLGVLSGKKDVERLLVEPQPEAPRGIYDVPGADTVVEPYRSELDASRFGFEFKMSRLGAVEATFHDWTLVDWRCPWGAPGDRLWVREAWAYWGGDEYLYQCDPDAVAYRATYADDVRLPLADRLHGKPPGGRWRPSIHMPQWASRITLDVVNVRVERLHAVDDADALREGVRFYDPEHLWPEGHTPPFTPREVFNHLWVRFKGVASWVSNPWVWRIEFKAKEKER